MKFFFNADEGKELYSEVFININPSNQLFEFKEKDKEYGTPSSVPLLSTQFCLPCIWRIWHEKTRKSAHKNYPIRFIHTRTCN